MSNLQDDGWDLSDLKYMEVTDAELNRYRLVTGDILFNRTNSKELVGKCAVFREPGEWIFASYLIRVRTDNAQLNPQFASDFLGTRIGRLQIDRLSRQIIGMTNINADEIRSLRIPLPSLSKQAEFVAEMDAARTERQKQLAHADALLTGIDDFLIETLGLTRPPEDARRVFAVRLSQARTKGRLNADYYHPERILALRAMEVAANTLTVSSLGRVVSFQRDKIDKPGENYLSLAHVQSNTGELSGSMAEAAGNCYTYEPNDVLFARLRPYLNKVYRAEASGCCSPEFHVLRVMDSSSLLPEYLAAVLRSRLVLAQTVHMMTGNTHPRLANEDVVDLLIPVPDADIQKTVADEVQRRRVQATRIREEAEAEWKAAKLSFEEQLLGGPTP